MTQPKLWLALICSAALLPGCTPASNTTNNATTESGATVDTAQHDKAIRAAIDRWLSLIKAKDAAGISQLYTEDGMFMPPNAPLARGHDAVRQQWQGLLDMPEAQLTFAPDEIIIAKSGELAVDRGTYQLSAKPASGAINDAGKYIVVWRNRDGQWRAAMDMFSSDKPAG